MPYPKGRKWKRNPSKPFICKECGIPVPEGDLSNRYYCDQCQETLKAEHLPDQEEIEQAKAKIRAENDAVYREQERGQEAVHTAYHFVPRVYNLKIPKTKGRH